MGNQIGVTQTYILNHFIVLTSNSPKCIAHTEKMEDEMYISKYGIMMENEPIDQDKLEACKYVLIRHAMSTMNY